MLWGHVMLCEFVCVRTVSACCVKQLDRLLTHSICKLAAKDAAYRSSEHVSYIPQTSGQWLL